MEGSRLRRDVTLVLVAVVVAGMALGGGIYLLWRSMPAPRGPTTYTHAPRQWTVPLTPGLTWESPVLGPTSPLASDRGGGEWLVNWAREGRVRMDFAQYTFLYNESPFLAGGESIALDLRTDFGIPYPSGAALEGLYYVVPGTNITAPGDAGARRDNGLLVAFAGSNVWALDPFTKGVVFQATLPFVPTVTGEDPASAGVMYILPFERTACSGILCNVAGPYRYFYASDLNHTVVFELTYVHEGDRTPPSGRLVLEANATLTAPPFVYYDQNYVNSTDAFRSGPGQAIVLPLANDTLAVYDVTGSARGFVPLSLSGEPAFVTGIPGFVRSPFPLWLYLPLRSANHVGIGVLDLGSLAIRGGLAFHDPGLALLGTPVSEWGQSLVIAPYNPANDTTWVAVFSTDSNANFTVDPSANWYLSGRIRGFFEVVQMTDIFVRTASGDIVLLQERSPNGSPVPPGPFGVHPPSTSSFVVYAGSAGGTLYGSALIPQELLGAWTDSAAGSSALFELLGPLVPAVATSAVPPGGSWSTLAASGVATSGSRRFGP